MADLLSLVAKIGIDDKEYQKGIEGAQKKAGGLGSALKAGFGVAATAIAAASAAVVKFTQKSIEAYAEYEQLEGGVKKLYGNMGQSLEEYAENTGQTIDQAKAKWQELETAQNTMLSNAQNAFKTTGMSANSYIQNVTGFSASLINSLGGDTNKAADVADMAMRDIADNANTFGRYSAEELAQVYQNLSKGMFQTMDNLALGYKGSKEGMQELIDHVNQVKEANGELGNLSIDNFADMVEAIHVVQEEMNITGTTEREAAQTIQGSIAMTKAAWENLLTGIADENADLDSLVNNLVDSVVKVAENIEPKVVTVLDGIGRLASGLGETILPKIAEQLPTFVSEILPALLSAAQSVLTALVNAFPQLVEVLLGLLPQVVSIGVELILALVTGITESLPTLIPAATAAITQIVLALTQPDSLTQLIMAAVELMLALADGLIDAIPTLIGVLPEIVENIVRALIALAPRLSEAAFELILKLARGIITYYATLNSAIRELGEKAMNAFKSWIGNAKNWGKDLIDNFINGIKTRFDTLKNEVGKLANLFTQLKHSTPTWGPLKDDDEWMPDMMDNFIGGIRKGIPSLKSAVDDVATTISGNITGVISGDASGVGGTTVIQNNHYSNPHTDYEVWKSGRELERTVKMIGVGAV